METKSDLEQNDVNKSPTKPNSSPMHNLRIKVNNKLVFNYLLLGILLTFMIFVFSIFMAGVASYRNDIADTNYENTSRIFNDSLEQNSPTLGSVSKNNQLAIQNDLSDADLRRYAQNTFLSSTDGVVVMDADFVKKGLAYQPSYETNFTGKYILTNKLDEPSLIAFDFPFPVSTNTYEISNVTLMVNGEKMEDVKVVDGLKWEGEIPANSDIDVEVSYSTVGLAYFTYDGIDNPVSSQDFKFEVSIIGTRAYDVKEGLSVDSREFGDDSVKLVWDKPDLFSKPHLKVSIGEKINPSVQVSRIYFTMTPIYIVFMTVILYLAYRFGKSLKLFDMFLVTLLFIIYFPLIHYVSSFTIDPTLQVFSGIDVGYFSMPLYAAFLVSWSMVAGLIFYFLSKQSSISFSIKFVLPSLVLFLGFFPLVVTIPEYSMLLVLIGSVALLAIIMQVRLKSSD